MPREGTMTQGPARDAGAVPPIERARSIVRGSFLISGDRIIERGAFYQEEGSIREVGRYDDLRNRHPGAFVLGSDDVAVVPGFVNAHQHGRGMTHFALGEPDDCLEPWLT